MDTEAALFFRDELRQARAVALRDAEAFEEIVFVLERMGSFLKGGGIGLKDYEEVLCEEARKSPLACEIPITRKARDSIWILRPIAGSLPNRRSAASGPMS